MTGEQIRLVRVTWLQAAPNAQAVARFFYERLFELDPEVRRLFGYTDMVAQRRELLVRLTVCVGALDRVDAIRSPLDALAARLADCGVRDRHYAGAESALLWTMAQVLGEAWTAEVSEAWSVASGALTSFMRRATGAGERAA
ncbi:MAG: globin domain-containing protein [Gemmatimonadales bacterium]